MVSLLSSRIFMFLFIFHFIRFISQDVFLLPNSILFINQFKRPFQLLPIYTPSPSFCCEMKYSENQTETNKYTKIVGKEILEKANRSGYVVTDRV